MLTPYDFRVFRIPIQSVLLRYPELAEIWNREHQRWVSDIKGQHIHQLSDDLQTGLHEQFYTECWAKPDKLKYAQIEFMGDQHLGKATHFWSRNELTDGWFQNQGKLTRNGQFNTEHFGTRGLFWYRTGGFREWHTNHVYTKPQHIAGWRMYFVDVEEEGKSHFHSLDRFNTLSHLPDIKGYVNIFHFPINHLFWHAVSSDTNRFSLGFKPAPSIVDDFVSFIKASGEET
jgi:hypothetical protein